MTRTIGVIASGPSCTAEDARKLCAAVETIAVNDCYRLAPAHHLYACDYRWWDHHIADVMQDFDGTLWTQSEGWITNANKPVDPAQWGIKQLKSLDRVGLSTTQGVIHQGRNSGFQAVNLAYLLGAKRIILIGFDMGLNGNQRHWFGDHPGVLNASSNYADFIRHFETINPKDYGIEIINCSRQTALQCFPREDLDAALAVV